MKKKLLAVLFSFFFLVIIFSSKNSAFAATCSSIGGSCIPNSICTAEGGRSISGTGCTTSQVCCDLPPYNTPTLTPTPTPIPSCSSKGGTCVPSTICTAEGGTRVTATCSSGVCCVFPSSTPTPTPLPSCASRGGSCVPSTVCTGEGGTRVTATCSSGVCCVFPTPTTGPPPPPPPPSGSTKCSDLDPEASCKTHNFCDSYGIAVPGATDCEGLTPECCKYNTNVGKCPVCPPSGPNPDAQYRFDSYSQTCVNDRGSSVAVSEWQTCATGQSCYNGQGCVAGGFSTGQLPCDSSGGKSCPTAFGFSLSTDPQGLVKAFFGVLLSIAGVIAVLLIIISGYRLTTSQGNPEAIQYAKEQLTAAIVGLLFIILSFSILNFIGINLLNLPGQ